MKGNTFPKGDKNKRTKIHRLLNPLQNQHAILIKFTADHSWLKKSTVCLNKGPCSLNYKMQK
jgi:hypothetical protein